ncbi:nucleotidyl transferase [Mycobacterium phage MoMoMixon]|uniref:Nucleotidyl transferase n=1 Tax=Mycobacterium phage MoMoMixon TaxID=1088865 RepID=G8ICW5_9CAUD|nr:NrdC-like protein [Mycobacterium phage MoMoMixon]AER25603.1 nucleotidyl transferase [Mycobacterium phage MoMoMixon]QAY12563.1 nucleotidyltransferase [Mycobacterium phage Nidhogg]
MSGKPTEELQPQDVLHEPVQGAFETSHSSSHHQQIALDGLIYLSEVGSTLHGVSTDATSDDIDEMGITIEPPRCVIGFEQFDLYEYRTKPVGVRSGPGDIDRTIYSLRKYAKLLADGNPTVLMPMFAPADKLRYVHPLGQVLRENVGHFLSRQTGQRFLGYLNSQRSRYLDPERTDTTHSARPELIEAYGWDTKTGYHALRLAIQGAELMKHRTITLPMCDEDREYLLRVRGGEFTKEDVTWVLDQVFIPTLKRSIEQSTLPEQPEWRYINHLLVQLHQEYWTDHGWV